MDSRGSRRFVSIFHVITEIVAFLLGLAWSLVIIAIAWSAYRPILSGILLAVVVVVLFLLRQRSKKKKE